jgi:hypothetical protein
MNHKSERKSPLKSDPGIAAIVASVLIGLFLIFGATNQKEGGADWDGVIPLLVFLWVIVFAISWYVVWVSRHPEEAKRRAAARQAARQAAKKQAAERQIGQKYPARPTSPNPQEIIEYTSYKDFEADRPRWLAKGWKVASISDTPQRAGLVRFATLGLGALVIKPGSHAFVVYERETVVESVKPSQPAATSSTASPHPTANASLSAELERLASLRDAGTLTAEEFERAKQKLLNG